ncbi:CLUMA_CG017035, isoform A [Clunio marinus]|uniref:CLUMA_CG017035, isoform A n=1 Tax=Clunio marinus TaxID=568069 RepID=A0A1J1IW39_9DIPT|nr:CLUMA_CG017035, isoform A [Clunio marinus]
MYQNFGLYALIAVILLINVNSIEVSEKPLEIGLEIQNATVSEISQNIDKESSTQEGKTKNMTKDNFSDEKSESTTSSTVTTRLDPVTNLITKVNYSSEASSKSLKDLSKSQDAKISSTNVGITINDKVKQAIINSKTQAFKNLNDLNGNLRTKAKQDQDAKSAHVHNDITNEKPSEKEFLPSPEVSSLYTPQNVPQDHFSPMNHYYRPVKHDAQFPIELPVPKHTNTMLDTRWLGADHLPAEVHKPTAERYSSPQQRSPIRSFPFSFPSNQLNPPSHQPSPAHNKVVFPVEGRTTSGESHYQSHAHSTDANQPSWLPKSIWKWMSGDEKASSRPPTPHSYETKTLDSDLDNWKPPSELHTNTHFHHYWNSHDHSPPSTLPESWPTDHDITFKPEGKQESDGKSDEKDEEEGGKSNEKKPYYNKLTVIPPWISILGMAAAAIPIGALS